MFLTSFSLHKLNSTLLTSIILIYIISIKKANQQLDWNLSKIYCYFFDNFLYFFCSRTKQLPTKVCPSKCNHSQILLDISWTLIKYFKIFACLSHILNGSRERKSAIRFNHTTNHSVCYVAGTATSLLILIDKKWCNLSVCRSVCF